MSAPEVDILLCRAQDRPGPLVPGSLPGSCSGCGRGIWIAPSSIIMMHDNPGTLTLCLSCAGRCMAAHGGTVIPLTPAQLEERPEWPNEGET